MHSVPSEARKREGFSQTRGARVAAAMKGRATCALGRRAVPPLPAPAFRLSNLLIIFLLASVFCLLLKGFFPLHSYQGNSVLYILQNPLFYISVFKNVCCLLRQGLSMKLRVTLNSLHGLCLWLFHHSPEGWSDRNSSLLGCYLPACCCDVVRLEKQPSTSRC